MTKTQKQGFGKKVSAFMAGMFLVFVFDDLIHHNGWVLLGDLLLFAMNLWFSREDF